MKKLILSKAVVTLDDVEYTLLEKYLIKNLMLKALDFINKIIETTIDVSVNLLELEELIYTNMITTYGEIKTVVL